MSEESTRMLENLVENEYVYRICTIIITSLLLACLFAWFLYDYIQTKKTQRIREEWFVSLTEEQRKAIREQKNLKL